MATTNVAIEPLRKGSNFGRWLQRFEAQMEWQTVTDEKKKHALLALLGPEAFDLVADACLPRKPAESTYTALVKVLSTQLQPKKLPIAARYEFYQLKQDEDNVNTYLRKLKNASEECVFGVQLNDRLRDQLVFGLSNKDALKRMLTEKLDDLTLEKATEIANSYEAVYASQKTLIGHKQVEDRNLFALKSSFVNKPKGNNIKFNNERGSKFNNDKPPCVCCGRSGHSKEKCFYKRQSCHTCGKVGHTKAVCRSKKREVTHKRDSVHNVTENDSLLFNIGKGLFEHIVSIQGRKVKMIFDTGSEVSIINERVHEALGGDLECPLVQGKNEIKAYGDNKIPVKGQTNLLVTDVDQTIWVPALVIKGTLPCIYGCDWIRKFRPDFSVNRILKDAKQKFTVSLYLKDDAQPKFYRPRQLPYGLLKPVQEEISRLVSKGILVKVEKSDWATPIVPVVKPDGSIRLCGDYKVTLNTSLQNMVSTTRPLEDIVNSLQGSNWFSELDLRNAYHQLPLDEKSSNLTTLSTPFGLYRHAFLPFGIKTAPAIFQATMEKLLSNIKNVQIYQDNIYIHGTTKQNHDETYKAVKERLSENQFELNEKKCKICFRQISILGTLIDGKVAKPDPDKVKAINSMPNPRNVKEIRSFIGMIEFYGKFIPNLSEIKEPLTKLTRKGQKFQWGKEESQAFDKLKESLCRNAMVQLYDPQKKLSLFCDASPIACAAVLQQDDSPVMFISKTLSATERNYAQIEREALSLVWAIKRLHKFLIGQRFTLYTDNQPIQYIFNPSKAIPSVAAARIQRWALFLMNYDFDIKHIKGINNSVADCLSRNIDQKANTFDTFNIALPDHSFIDKRTILKSSTQDELMKQLFYQTKWGWSNYKHRKTLQQYAPFRYDFNIINSLLYRGQRLVIPKANQTSIMSDLHEGHPGMTAMKSLARQSVWWLGIDKDIESFCRRCRSCAASKDTNRSQWIPWPEEQDPWSRIHIDFAGPFEGGLYALVIVDAFSKWPEVHLMTDMKSSTTIDRLRRTFSQEGVPSTLVCDNGPSFTSHELKKWLSLIGCRQVFTPPYHPRSNGLAERFVRTLKEHLRAAKEVRLQVALDKFLLVYRNTPHSSTGKEPSIMLKGHLLRTKVTALSSVGDSVYVKSHKNTGDKWIPATILGNEGSRIVTAKTEDDHVGRYHVEHTKPHLHENPDAMKEEEEKTENQNEKPPTPKARTLRPREELKPPDRYGYEQKT